MFPALLASSEDEKRPPAGGGTPTEGLTTRRASSSWLPKTLRGVTPTTRPQKTDAERAVLAFLIDQHPTRLKRDELPLALNAKDFAEKDAIARAVRELAGVGLVQIDGDLVGPTRAALRFEELESE